MNLSKRFEKQGSVFSKIIIEKVASRERSIRVSGGNGGVGDSYNFEKVQNTPILIPNPIVPTLPIFSINTSTQDSSRDPDTMVGYIFDSITLSDTNIGSWLADLWLNTAVPGHFQFHINSDFSINEPVGGEIMPTQPRIKYNNGVENVFVEATANNGTWPTVWSAGVFNYQAIYDITFDATQNVISLSHLDEGTYPFVSMKMGGTLSIGYEVV